MSTRTETNQLPYTAYAVALLWEHKREDRRHLSVMLFTVSGRQPLSQGEATARAVESFRDQNREVTFGPDAWELAMSSVSLMTAE